MKLLPIAPGGAPSGSIGGTTYSHNRYGYYARLKSIPTNPSTERQQAIRNYFQTLAVVWGVNLSAAQRLAWNTYGQAITKIDALGQEYTLPGFNWFVGNNTAILQAGGSRVDDGPTTLTLPDTDPVFAAAVSEATGLITITFDDTLDWASEDDAFMTIKMSAPGGAGTTFNKGPYRLAGALAGDSGTPITSPQTLTAPFTIAEDQVVTVEARILRADGRVSAPFRSTISVGA